jgi:ADP-ribose pyrophosphatase YjhB (NUDIX family)
MTNELTKLGTSVIVTSSDNILLIRNVRTQTWELPGGKVDMNESIVHAASRELGEEIGLRADPVNLEFIGYFEHHSRPTYEEENWCNMIFAIDFSRLEDGGRCIQNKEPDKHDRWGWFQVHRLPCKTWNVASNCIIQLLEKRRRER